MITGSLNSTSAENLIIVWREYSHTQNKFKQRQLQRQHSETDSLSHYTGRGKKFMENTDTGGKHTHMSYK